MHWLWATRTRYADTDVRSRPRFSATDRTNPSQAAEATESSHCGSWKHCRRLNRKIVYRTSRSYRSINFRKAAVSPPAIPRMSAASWWSFFKACGAL
jgi:hypothetical protein